MASKPKSTSPRGDRVRLHADLDTFREQNNRLHNATRQEITGLRSEVTGLRGEVSGLRGEVTDLRQRVETGFADVDKGFADIEGRLDATAAGQAQIVTMLTELINRQDPHEHE